MNMVFVLYNDAMPCSECSKIEHGSVCNIHFPTQVQPFSLLIKQLAVVVNSWHRACSVVDMLKVEKDILGKKVK
jgi:hypothetical protein